MTKPCVLVIDDEAAMCETLKAILETEDYDVLTTGDARDGLNVVNKEPVNLIISDVRLPGMSGIEREYQAIQKTPSASRRFDEETVHRRCQPDH